MGEGCCEAKEVYKCSKGSGCPDKEVKKGDAAPECCGEAMVKKSCCGS